MATLSAPIPIKARICGDGGEVQIEQVDSLDFDSDRERLVVVASFDGPEADGLYRAASAMRDGPIGVQWPDPGDREPGDTVEVVVQCYVEANGGGDPLGEFDDGEPCGEEITVFRRVLGDGRFGPVSQAEAQKP